MAGFHFKDVVPHFVRIRCCLEFTASQETQKILAPRKQRMKTAVLSRKDKNKSARTKVKLSRVFKQVQLEFLVVNFKSLIYFG